MTKGAFIKDVQRTGGRVRSQYIFACKISNFADVGGRGRGIKNGIIDVPLTILTNSNRNRTLYGSGYTVSADLVSQIPPLLRKLQSFYANLN